jgi:hypothetical protein
MTELGNIRAFLHSGNVIHHQYALPTDKAFYHLMGWFLGQRPYKD